MFVAASLYTPTRDLPEAGRVTVFLNLRVRMGKRQLGIAGSVDKCVPSGVYTFSSSLAQSGFIMCMGDGTYMRMHSCIAY